MIKKSPQLISFLASSALDQLSEATKLNVAIPISNCIDKDNQSNVNTISNSNSINLVPTAEDQLNTSSSSLKVQTKAALKYFENTIQPEQQLSVHSHLSHGDLKLASRSSSLDNLFKRPSGDYVSNEAKKLKKEPDLKMCFPNLTSQSSIQSGNLF